MSNADRDAFKRDYGVGCDPPGTTVKLVDESGEEIKPYEVNKTPIDINGNWEWRVAEARHRELVAASILPFVVLERHGNSGRSQFDATGAEKSLCNTALVWADLLIKVARGE